MSSTPLKDKIRRIAYADSYWKETDWLELLTSAERAEISDEDLIHLKNNMREHADLSNALSRIEAIRAEMQEQGLDYYLVERRDEFNNEYVPACNERLAFATGFTGSAGFALISHDRVILFTDSRYTLQSREECPDNFFMHEALTGDALEKWLKAHIKTGDKIGFDPKISSYNTERTLSQETKQKKAMAIGCDQSPLDTAWEKLGRPPLPLSPVFILDETYTGRSFKEKKSMVHKALETENCDTAIWNDLAAIAYFLNLRGRDVDCSPFFLSYLIMEQNQVTLYIDQQKLSNEVQTYLRDNDVTVKDFDLFYTDVADIKNRKVWLDPSATPVQVKTLLDKNNNDLTFKLNPIDPIKALKTKAEQHGTIKAHEIDGLALIKFLHWLDTEAQDGSKTELDAVAQLEAFRREHPDFKDPSFDTISGAGSNGAIVHYRSTPKTNKKIEPNSLFLCDSGGQYFGGTTDVTRTIAIGTPTEEMRKNYTLVLQGHIRVAIAQLTKDTTGEDLDIKAREALKAEGLNFGHGVGHGVGSYLSVHEGPCGIHRGYKGPYEEGMVISNEPGFYKDGEYGIRIENLVLVQNNDQKSTGMHFKTLTLAPMDRRLIVEDMLTAEEKEWLDHYHEQVYKTLAPHLNQTVSDWLQKQTKPISGNPSKSPPVNTCKPN